MPVNLLIVGPFLPNHYCNPPDLVICTRTLLIYLEDRLGHNSMDKLDLLSCARQWLELEDKIPTAFTPYRAHEKQSALSVAAGGENAPDVS
jgi:hypothetical protein